MRLQRLVGGVAGLLMLVGVFAVNFLNYASGSLWGIAYFYITDPTTGFLDILALEITVVVATIIIIVAGLVGLRPKTSGILGLVGSVLLVIAGYANPSSTTTWSVTDYGAGMYLILAGTLIALVVGIFWKSKAPPGPQPVAQEIPPPPPQTQPAGGETRFCPNCGKEAAGGQKYCKYCGASLA